MQTRSFHFEFSGAVSKMLPAQLHQPCIRGVEADACYVRFSQQGDKRPVFALSFCRGIWARTLLIAIANSIGLHSCEMLNTFALTVDYSKKMAVMHEVCDRLGKPLAVFPMMSGHPGNFENEPHVRLWSSEQYIAMKCRLLADTNLRPCGYSDVRNSSGEVLVYCLTIDLLAVAVDLLGYQRRELPGSGNVKVRIVNKIMVLKICDSRVNIFHVR